MNRDTSFLQNISAPHQHETSSTTIQYSENLKDVYNSSSDDDAKEKATDAEKKQQSIVKPDTIRPYDILCGRDKATFNNVGNRRFRISIGINIPRYEAAKTKAQKASVIIFVCNILRENVGVRFLKKQSGGAATAKEEKQEDYHYIELNETEARKKVGHALRDMSVARQQLKTKRKSVVAPKRQRDDESNADDSNKKAKSITFDGDEVGGSFTALLPYMDDSNDAEDNLLEPLPIHELLQSQSQSQSQSQAIGIPDDSRQVPFRDEAQQSQTQLIATEMTQDPNRASLNVQQQHQQFQQRQQQLHQLLDKHSLQWHNQQQLYYLPVLGISQHEQHQYDHQRMPHLLQQQQHYAELNETEARKKVGHALRDMSVARQQLNTKRKSVVATKRQRDDESNADDSNKKANLTTFDGDEVGDSFTALLPYIVDSKQVEDNLLEPLPIQELPQAQSQAIGIPNDPRRVSFHDEARQSQSQLLATGMTQDPHRASLRVQQQQQQQFQQRQHEM